MGLQESRVRIIFLLLFLLGVSVLWIGGVVADDPETNTVQQYTVYEVSDDDGELVVAEVRSGEERRGSRASRVNVDEEIVCLPSVTRDCALAAQEQRGEINATGLQGAFRYAYLDGEFYRIARNSSDFEFEYELTDASTAFAALALDSDRLVDAEREALEDGQIVTTRPIPHVNELVEYEGDYYTIQQTAIKVYGDRGSSCQSSGDDFCNEADDHRGGWLLPLGLRALGLGGTVAGGGGLFREYYAAYTDS